jgi:hypothetical protein
VEIAYKFPDGPLDNIVSARDFHTAIDHLWSRVCHVVIVSKVNRCANTAFTSRRFAGHPMPKSRAVRTMPIGLPTKPRFSRIPRHIAVGLTLFRRSDVTLNQQWNILYRTLSEELEVWAGVAVCILPCSMGLM